MVVLALYLLKASACMALFYLLYRIAFAHHTFFHLNRIYLLGSLMLSIAIPLIAIPVESTFTFQMETLPQDQLPDYGAALVSRTATAVTEVNSFIPVILFSIYTAGVLVVLIRLLIGVRNFYRIKRCATMERFSEGSILRTDTAHPFTFFKYVVVGYESPREVILHETAHANQFHSVDMLFSELVCAMFWFNPVAYWYRRALQQQHEFLADEYVINQRVSPETYLSVMMEQITSGVAPAFGSKFSSSLIKNRIYMITKNRSSYVKLTLYVLVVPVVVALLFSFSTTEKDTDAVNSKTPVQTIAAKVLQANVPSEAPVDMSRLKKMQGYGDRMHPVLNKVVKHTGVDFILDEGEDVMATADGEVVTVASDEKRGNYIVIKHNEEYSTQYFHLKSFNVKEGQRVKSKEVIGLVGNTGLSQAFHLHYEVVKSGVSVDPVKYLPQ